MARVDFVISNNRHHRAMTWPLAEALADLDPGRCRVLSLCELRGVRSPAAGEAPRGAEIRPVLPFHLRRSPSLGGPSAAGGAGRARSVVRDLTWRLLIGPRFRTLLADRPDLVVLPNDAAYPYDRIAILLRSTGVPFILLQEGIRFPLPISSDEPAYGTGGATAVAAWGPASGDYFRSVGVPAERVHLTGSPRFDLLRPPRDDGERRRARSALGLSRRTLALISNPIDDQGFCSHDEKMELFGHFLQGIQPLFAAPEFHLAVKLHGRESAADFERRIPTALHSRVSVLTNVALSELLYACGAAIVLASTVGLEALLCGVPLAVLEIPGHGFQYDYVQSETAAGLAWDAPMAPQVDSLFEPSAERQHRVEAYLTTQFSGRGKAVKQVADLIQSLLANHS